MTLKRLIAIYKIKRRNASQDKIIKMERNALLEENKLRNQLEHQERMAVLNDRRNQLSAQRMKANESKRKIAIERNRKILKGVKTTGKLMGEVGVGLGKTGIQIAKGLDKWANKKPSA